MDAVRGRCLAVGTRCWGVERGQGARPRKPQVQLGILGDAPQDGHTRVLRRGHIIRGPRKQPVLVHEAALLQKTHQDLSTART